MILSGEQGTRMLQGIGYWLANAVAMRDAYALYERE